MLVQSTAFRTAIYVRVSTAAQEEEGTSLDTQEESCRRYAAEQGWSVDEAHIYREQFSGYTRERPLLSQLRTAVREKEVDAVLVYAVDRLSRNQTDLTVLVDEMERNSVHIACVSEPLESTPVGKLIMNVRAFAAELEREKIRERTLRGKIEVAKRGKLSSGGGHNLFGTHWMKGEGRREIDPVTAPVIQQIFQWVGDEGLTLYGVVTRLMESGIPSPTGNHLWTVSTLCMMLRNESYLGVAHVFRTTRKPAKKRRNPQCSRGTGYIKPREEWITVENVTPQLVSLELFQRVQERLAYNLRFSNRNAKHEYLLRGRIVCGTCGHAYIGRTGAYIRKDGTRTERQYYNCSTKVTRHETRCSGSFARMAAVDTGVWEYVRELLEDPARIVTELQRQQETQVVTNVERDLEAIRLQIEKLAMRERKLLNLALAMDDDDESTAVFQREHRTIKEHRDRLRAEEQLLEARTKREVITAESITDVLAYCERVRRNLDKLTVAEKREVFDALNIHVTVETDGESVRVDGFVPSVSVAFTQSGWRATTATTPPGARRDSMARPSISSAASGPARRRPLRR